MDVAGLSSEESKSCVLAPAIYLCSRCGARDLSVNCRSLLEILLEKDRCCCLLGNALECQSVSQSKMMLCFVEC